MLCIAFDMAASSLLACRAACAFPSVLRPTVRSLHVLLCASYRRLIGDTWELLDVRASLGTTCRLKKKKDS